MAEVTALPNGATVGERFTSGKSKIAGVIREITLNKTGSYSIVLELSETVANAKNGGNTLKHTTARFCVVCGEQITTAKFESGELGQFDPASWTHKGC
jgi:hypothetical protein